MDKFAIIGYPVAHSLSPQIHNQLFKDKQIDAIYEIKPVQNLNHFFKAEAMSYKGFNVTMPLKQEIIKYLNKIKTDVPAINTVTNNNGFYTGYNTDELAIIELLKPLGLKSATLIGAGGAATATISALNKLNINYHNAVRNNMQPLYNPADILINATPLGMESNPDFSNFDFVNNYNYIFDMVYNPVKTNLLKSGEKCKKTLITGLDLLKAQAIIANDIFTTNIYFQRP